MHTKFNNGDFDIEKKLGDGTFGEIYTATTKKDSKAVVLKVIPFLSAKRRLSFLRESSISQKLHTQSNIISIDSCYYNDKVGVLVMEKMDCDLLDFVMRHETLPERVCKVIFKEVCKALYQCHSNGISHLDIKPDNILLKFNEQRQVNSVKLADFGFSFDFSKRAKRDVEQTSDKTSSFPFDFEFNQLVGTKEYRAPETHSAPEIAYQADKVDIWGLGITLFSMITGNFPFAEVDGNIICNDFNLVKKNCKDDKCFDLILNLLQINPFDRYNILQVLSHPWLCE